MLLAMKQNNRVENNISAVYKCKKMFFCCIFSGVVKGRGTGRLRGAIFWAFTA